MLQGVLWTLTPGALRCPVACEMPKLSQDIDLVELHHTHHSRDGGQGGYSAKWTPPTQRSQHLLSTGHLYICSFKSKCLIITQIRGDVTSACSPESSPHFLELPKPCTRRIPQILVAPQGRRSYTSIKRWTRVAGQKPGQKLARNWAIGKRKWVIMHADGFEWGEGVDKRIRMHRHQPGHDRLLTMH